jgi:hypothetical protein
MHMGAQDCHTSYLIAFDQANADLDEIFNEYDWLLLRKKQIENALLALQPFLEPSNSFQQPIHHPAPIAAPAVSAEPAYEMLEPVASAIAPGSEDITDPIQYRINRALGLAVA